MMSRTIRIAAGVVAALMAMSTAATSNTGATERSSSAVTPPSATAGASHLRWGDWLDCPPTDAGAAGSVGWELTTASPRSGKLEDIERLRFSSECPGITHAMTFDVWAEYPVLVMTAEIDFVGPVNVTMSQTDLRALGLGTFQGAGLWGGAALVKVAPQTQAPGTTVLSTFGPRTTVQE
jgi:hypothetical protein